MERKFKELIKEAVLEALIEFTNGGVATLAGEGAGGSSSGSSQESGGNSENSGNSGNSGQGGGSESSSGGGLNNGRPIPDVGVGAFSLRNKSKK